MNASDIHIQVASPPLFRIQGELVEVKYPPLSPQDTDEIADIILKAKKINPNTKDFSEYDTSYGIPNVGRFRANIFRQRGSFAVVLRVVPLLIMDYATLNLPPVLEDIANTRRGLILITGATGMGKSTTIAAMIEYINSTRKSHIITLEDPIEFLFRNKKSVVSQREIGTDTPDFKFALRSALRQDPDIIMVGELRDYETVDMCIKASETGHLVISSIHTPDVLKTIGRVVGFFPTEEQSILTSRLAENLMAIISLRLVPAKIAGFRLPALEILRVTRTAQELIKNPERTPELVPYMEKNKEFGMRSFDQHLVEMFKEDKITIDAAKLASTNPAEIERMIMLEGEPH